jgi:diadenosine tetraphosphatase ApaH/serine/threonine PP2A family protein phosphatase
MVVLADGGDGAAVFGELHTPASPPFRKQQVDIMLESAYCKRGFQVVADVLNVCKLFIWMLQK